MRRGALSLPPPFLPARASAHLARPLGGGRGRKRRRAARALGEAARPVFGRARARASHRSFELLVNLDDGSGAPVVQAALAQRIVADLLGHDAAGYHALKVGERAPPLRGTFRSLPLF